MAQTEEGGGVLDGVVGVEGPDHRLVAGGFNVPAEEPVGQPQQGIAPVQAQGHPGQGLGPVISPADVGLLVEENVLPVTGGHAGGEIDPGTEKTADKGAANLVALIDVVPEEDCLRQLPPETEVGDPAPKEHPPGPQQPKRSDQVRPGEGRGFLLGRGRERRLCGGQHRRRGLFLDGRRGHRGLLPGRGGCKVGSLGDGGGDEAHRQGKAHRADHPQEDHRPQAAENPPGGLFQQPPQNHHAQGGHRGGGGHGEQRLEDGVHGCSPSNS